MKRMQLRGALSPGGVHEEVATVQNLPSRKTASSRRSSPVSIGLAGFIAPTGVFCFASGGSLRFLIVRSVVTGTLVPPPTPGTPVSDQRVSLVLGSGVEAMKSVEVDDRLLAGMIGKPVKSP